MPKLYTIQQIRDMIQSHSEHMNPYAHIRMAGGMKEVQALLHNQQIADGDRGGPERELSPVRLPHHDSFDD